MLRLLLILGLFSLKSYSQVPTVLVFDLENNTIDSITNIPFNASLTEAQTDFSFGWYNQNLAVMDGPLPVANTWPGIQFTKKERATNFFNLEDYPVRTSVRLASINNDTISSFCSGSIISERHVLSAAHCVCVYNEDSLRRDSIIIQPVFDEIANTDLPQSLVTKVYVFKNWNLTTSDFTVLETKERIGNTTGWISVGFQSDTSMLETAHYHKFSYPAISILALDPNEYNGDTLYYSHGEVRHDLNFNQSINIPNASGIPGESGSSIIKIQDGLEYCSYGVLHFSSDLRHFTINAEVYHAVYEIIKDDLVLGDSNLTRNSFSVYPNPCTNFFHIKSDYIAPTSINIRDINGRLIRSVSYNSSIDVSDLRPGIYLISFDGDDSSCVKLIKQ